MKNIWGYVAILMTTISLIYVTLPADGVQDGNQQTPSRHHVSGTSSSVEQPASPLPIIPIWFCLRFLKHLVFLVPLGLLFMGVLQVFPHRIPRDVSLWGTAVMLTTMSLVYATLMPGTIHKGINLIPFQGIVRVLQSFWGQRSPTSLTILVDIFGNLLLFFPFGFVLMGFLTRFPSHVPAGIVILIGSVLSVGIEAIQLAIPTRATDIDDVIFNTISTGLGVMAFFVVQKIWQKRGSMSWKIGTKAP